MSRRKINLETKEKRFITLMDTRKIDLKFEAAPVLYTDIQKAEIAILSISSGSKKLNHLLKSKLLSQTFLISKFQKNISRIIKNEYDENEITFLVINVFNYSDFKEKLIKLSYQFANTSLFIKCKNERLYLDVENKQMILRAVKKGLLKQLTGWNNGNFEFEDVIFLNSN